jgi:hypothetical protein
MDAMPEQDNERIARCFHEHYEQLAPEFGYRTRQASARPWDQVPAENRNLMIATVEALIMDEELFTPEMHQQAYEEGLKDGKAAAAHALASSPIQSPHKPEEGTA